MEEILDKNQVSVLEAVQENEEEISVSETPEKIEEIDSSPIATTSSKPVSRPIAKKEEPIPNPLLEDPYEWDKCTITVVYALHPDHSVTVSIHNHKDEPIVKSFTAADVPLPEKISSKMKTLQAIWPFSTISATVVLPPKPGDAPERVIVVSMRAGGDTPIVLTDLESNMTFPPLINSMLDELKALLPSRALKRIEKDAKTKIAPSNKSAAKTQSRPVPKPTTVPPAIANKTQLSLF